MRFIPPSIPWSSAPSSETATGSVGQIAYDSKYQYICVATNNWLRSPLLPWLPVTSGLQMNLDASFAASLFQNSNGTTAAASADSPVGYWADQSGLGNHATQATSGSRPLLKMSNQNGLPGLYLDGTDDFLTASIAGFQSLTAATILMVFKTPVAATADTTSATMFSWGNLFSSSGSFPAHRGFIVGTISSGSFAGEKLLFFTGAPGVNSNGRLGSTGYSRPANTAQSFVCTFASSGTGVYANNASVTLDLSSSASAADDNTPSNVGFTTDNNLLIGASRASGSLSYSMSMTVHQILVYNRVLSADERTSLWNYLSAKWGIS